MTYPFGPTVTQISRVDAGAENADGNSILTAVSVTYQAIAFAQNATVEVTTGGDQVTVDGLLTVQAGTGVSPQDQFLIGGSTYEVTGVSSEPVSPWSGWNPGVVVQLKLVNG